MTTSPTSGPDARAHEQFAADLRERGLKDDTADALADAYFAGRPRRGRKLRQPESADALVTSLQLADLAAGREPVESAVIREVRRRREEMAAAEVRAGRRGTP